VEDHAEALELAFTKGRAGETYAIGSRNEQRNIDLVRMLCDIVDGELGVPPEGPRQRLITFVKDRPGHDRRYAVDPTKAEFELGWGPRHGFREALQSTVRWYLAHGEWLSHCRSGEYREYHARNYAGRG
jgi:dTDP-glucose 4,6-dehydratase